MLKISKGLKKKKKGKKNKRKGDELFDEAEFEKYKKEQELKQQQQQEEGEQSEVSKHPEEDEEWKKFKALTSGVDDILKKTQGDLDRIKSTSYFQKLPPTEVSSANKTPVVSARKEVEQKREQNWVDFEESEKSIRSKTSPETTEHIVNEAAFVCPDFEEEEESEEDEEEEDLFDTSYVDAVASGEVKLAYIPESPVEENCDQGFDPFDTSIVDKVIKTDPKELKRNLVSLGSAVEVLTGKTEKLTSQLPVESVQGKRRRPKPQDLLLGSFDESTAVEQNHNSEPTSSVGTVQKSILDDESIFDSDLTIDINGVTPIYCINKIIQIEAEKKGNSPNTENNLQNLIEEFVSPIRESVLDIVQNTGEDELDDEFEALAKETLCKQKTKPPRPEPPRPKINDKITCIDSENDEDVLEQEDPFDTSFAAKVLPGKYELRLIEKEILEATIPDSSNITENKINEVLQKSKLTFKNSFDEVFVDEQKLLSPSQRDLLGGSTTDLANVVELPIQPITKSNELSYCDPFDTSIVEKLVPGKTELKFIEKELLSPNEELIKSSILVTGSDDDFNPRAEEVFEVNEKPLRPSNLVGGKRASIPKIVAFNVQSENIDLLAPAHEDTVKGHKPLTPYYADPKELQEIPSFESESDPFDTSFVTSCPGKAELKLIENELVGNKSNLSTSLSDPDFDPRDSPKTTERPSELNIQYKLNEKIENITENKSDILSEEVAQDIKLHTPVAPKKVAENTSFNEIDDPFDTSIAVGLLPGKAEIKLLEQELIETVVVENSTIKTSEIYEKVIQSIAANNNIKNTKITDVLGHSPIDEVTTRPLTPFTSDDFDESNQDDIDPFDTSCVENIMPGKTELKLLESELLN